MWNRFNVFYKTTVVCKSLILQLVDDKANFFYPKISEMPIKIYYQFTFVANINNHALYLNPIDRENASLI